jgi:hypothetical protein
MNIIFFIPYYNNSHFIDIQIKSFRKYLKNCEWKICIIDDSNDSTINILSNVKEDIYHKCMLYPDELIYYKFDQTLHKVNSGVNKHCDILTHVVQSLSQQYRTEYDYLCLFDADMVFIEDFDVLQELEDYDIISPKRIQWLSNIQISNSPIFDYIFVHNCFFNLKTITNLNSMNLNTIPNTTCDTGSMIVEFLYNNPHYKIKYLNLSVGHEAIPELYDFEFFWNFKILHFRVGSVWDGILNRYNNFTYNSKFLKFCEIATNGLNETEKEIVDNTYKTHWNILHKKFTGIHATKQDLIKYGLCIE